MAGERWRGRGQHGGVAAGLQRSRGVEPRPGPPLHSVGTLPGRNTSDQAHLTSDWWQVLVGGEVFLVGGYSYTSGTPVSPVTLKLRSHFYPHHMKVDCRLCSEGGWVEVSPLTKARQQAACAEHNGKLYVMGGYGGGGGYLTSTGSNPHRSSGSRMYLAIKKYLVALVTSRSMCGYMGVYRDLRPGGGPVGAGAGAALPPHRGAGGQPGGGALAAAGARQQQLQ